MADKVEHYQRVVNKIADDSLPLLVFSDGELKPLHPSFLHNKRINPA